MNETTTITEFVARVVTVAVAMPERVTCPNLDDDRYANDHCPLCDETGTIPNDQRARLLAAFGERCDWIAGLACEHCGESHIDPGELANDPHKTHLCGKCGRLFGPVLLDGKPIRSVGIRDAADARSVVRPLAALSVLDGPGLTQARVGLARSVAEIMGWEWAMVEYEPRLSYGFSIRSDGRMLADEVAYIPDAAAFEAVLGALEGVTR